MHADLPRKPRCRKQGQSHNPQRELRSHGLRSHMFTQLHNTGLTWAKQTWASVSTPWLAQVSCWLAGLEDCEARGKTKMGGRGLNAQTWLVEMNLLVRGHAAKSPWSWEEKPHFLRFRIMFYTQFYDLTFKEGSPPVKFIGCFFSLENTTVVKNGFRTVYFHRIDLIPHAYVT